MSSSTFLTRVVIKQYRAIQVCDVKLGPLTFLVGLNGSGKSTFVDALRFVADALHSTIDQAVRERGGIDEFVTRSAAPDRCIGIRLEFRLPSDNELVTHGHYAFQIGPNAQGNGVTIVDEECAVHGPSGQLARYRIHAGRMVRQHDAEHRDGETSVSAWTDSLPIPSDRLFLLLASGLPPFRPVYDAFMSMAFYSILPDRIRALQPPDSGVQLVRDGSNLASVLGELATRWPDAKESIETYLRLIVPGLLQVERKTIDRYESIEFRQSMNGNGESVTFPASSMSDGTLRSLAILTALAQSRPWGTFRSRLRASLIAVEEPELAVHPGAAGILRHAMCDASRTTQIMATTHSADLLDEDDIDPRSILAVIREAGVTRIAPLDSVSRSVLRDGLMTAGELLRIDQLVPAGRAPTIRRIDKLLFDVARD